MGLTFQVLLCFRAGFYQEEWWNYSFKTDERAANRLWVVPGTRWLPCDGVGPQTFVGHFWGLPIGWAGRCCPQIPLCPESAEHVGWTELPFSQRGLTSFCASSPGSCGHHFPMLLDPALLLVWILAAPWESRMGSVASEWRAEMFYFQVSCWLPWGK